MADSAKAPDISGEDVQTPVKSTPKPSPSKSTGNNLSLFSIFFMYINYHTNVLKKIEIKIIIEPPTC